jgi:hypothetical protein
MMQKPVSRRGKVLRFFDRRAVMIVAACIGLLALLWVPTTQPFVASTPTVTQVVDPAALERHVRALSETFHPRSFDRKDKLDAAADYIAGEFARIGFAVEFQPFQVDGEIFRNVVVRIPDRAGSLAGERFVVGAHYDSHGDGEGEDSHTPGADDNASGVAGLIELARLLKLRPLGRPVDLVAFCLEEPPNFDTPDMGSAHHATALREAGARVRLMLSIEMIGYFNDAEGSQAYPFAPLKLFYPNRGDFIAVVGRYRDWQDTRILKGAMRGTGNIAVESINAPLFVPGIDLSDHLNYWKAGFPALMITDTAFYRNDQYHRRGDTADRLDFVRMAKVVSALDAGIRAFD